MFRMIATTLSPPWQPSLSSVSLSKSGIGVASYPGSSTENVEEPGYEARIGAGRRRLKDIVALCVPTLLRPPLSLLATFSILQMMKVGGRHEKLRNTGLIGGFKKLIRETKSGKLLQKWVWSVKITEEDPPNLITSTFIACDYW